jgi:hypothetical protein
MKKLRKFFTVSVMVLSIIAMSGLVVPTTAKAAASSGDLIKMAGNASVYYLGADGKRYVFPNSTTYFSWYTDFSGVITIPSSELQSYPLGGNVTMRPGTKLVKITTDPSVYAVEPNGTLRKIQSEAQAAALYGTNWSKRVVDVPDAFFTNYTIGSVLPNGSTPIGSLVKNASGADVYYYDGTNYRMIASEAALAANGFQTANIITAASTVTAGGTSITGAETALVKTSQGSSAATTVITGSGLMVSLSANTAPATTLIYGQALANLATFNFTAANDGEVKVTSVKLKRNGVSADALLSAVYLYDGTNRLTDNATVSSNYITFNSPSGLFTVAAGMTKQITVKSNIGASTEGSQVGVMIENASHISSTGAVVSGSFPVSGNLMSVSSATLATVAMNATTYPTTSTIDAGQSEIAVWKNIVSVGTREVNLERITLRQIGSINYNDITNLKFFVDGVQKGSTLQLGSDNYITFDFSSAPVMLNTGSRTLEVRGDIVNGSSKNYSFSLQRATDLAIQDDQYGAYVTATALPATTGTMSINSGSLTVNKTSDSATGNVTKDGSGVSLAKYEFKAYGESVKVEYLRVAVVESDGDTAFTLRNGAVYANGSQIGSTAAIPATTDATQGYVDFSLGSALIVNPGTPVIVEIKADLYDSDGTNDVAADDTLTARLVTYTSGAQRLTSLGYINVPTANVDGNVVTVKTGTVSLSKTLNYSSQNMVVPTNNYKLGSFVLSGNNIEDVNINSFEVAFTAGDQFAVTALNDVYLKYGSKTTSVKSTVSASGNTWSVSEVLGKSDNMTVEIYGNVSTFTVAGSNDSMISSLLVSGTTVGSSQSVTTNSGSVLAGQTMTAEAGAIASAVDAATPASTLIVANTTADLAAYKFTTTNDNYTLTEAVVTLGSAAAASNVTTLTLKDGSTVVTTAPIVLSGGVYQASFSGLTLAIPANTDKVLTVAATLGAINSSNGSSGAAMTATLTSFKANNSQGAETSDGTDRTGNVIYAYKSIPTIANQTLPTTVLTAGTQTLAKVSVTGTIGWKEMKFSISKSNLVELASIAVYDENGIAIPGAAIADIGAGTTGSAIFIPTAEQSVSGTKVYTLKATVGGTIASNNFVSTNILTDGFLANTTYALANADTNNFIWSDQSAASHSVTTTDWTGGYLVKSLSTDSQTLTAN